MIASHALPPVNGSDYAFAASAIIPNCTFRQVVLYKARPGDCSSALFYRSPGRTGDLFRTHKQKGSGINVPKPFLLAVGQYLRTDDPKDQKLSFNFSKEQIIYHEAI